MRGAAGHLVPEVGIEPTLPEGNGALSYVARRGTLADLQIHQEKRARTSDRVLPSNTDFNSES